MTQLETTPVADLGEAAYNFVKSSWVHSWFRGCGRNVDPGVFHKTFPGVATRLLEAGGVSLLHFPGNTDLFLGWIAVHPGEPHRLHYVYVKQAFRRQGMAKHLLTTHLAGDVTYSLQPVHQWKRDWCSKRGYKYDPHQLMIGD